MLGKWNWSEEGVTCQRESVLRLPYRPPAEYDFAVEFTIKGTDRSGQVGEVGQLCSVGDTTFLWSMGASENTVCRFWFVDSRRRPPKRSMQKVFAVFGSGKEVTPAVMKDLFATGLMYDPKHATDELVAERMQVMQIMNGHVMATMRIPNLVDRLGEIRCPTLGFWGMNEQMMPENGIMAMAKNMHQLRLILVTECGHWVMVEYAKLFNETSLRFLKGELG